MLLALGSSARPSVLSLFLRCPLSPLLLRPPLPCKSFSSIPQPYSFLSVYLSLPSFSLLSLSLSPISLSLSLSLSLALSLSLSALSASPLPSFSSLFFLSSLSGVLEKGWDLRVPLASVFRIRLSESAYPSPPIRVGLSESAYSNPPIRVRLSESAYPSPSIRVHLSEPARILLLPL